MVNVCRGPKVRYSGAMRWLLGAVLLVTGWLAAPSQAFANDYIGSKICASCHADIAAAFYRNPHNKSLVSGKEKPENTGCESCHGPGGDHFDAGGGKETIRAFSQLGPAQVLDACLRCHAQSISRANIRRSSHTQDDVVCTNCHSVHKAQTPKFLLAKQQTQLCYSCHSTVRAQFSMPFQAPGERGLGAMHGLPQSAWSLGSHLARGFPASHGRPGAGQRRALSQVPHR